MASQYQEKKPKTMHSELFWYITAGAAALWLTMLMTAIDIWVLGVRGKKKIGVLSARWGFFCSVLTYAWIFDSKRVQFNEAGLWIFLVVGIVAAIMAQVFIVRMV